LDCIGEHAAPERASVVVSVEELVSRLRYTLSVVVETAVKLVFTNERAVDARR